MGKPNPDIFIVKLHVPYRYTFQDTAYFIQQSFHLSPNNKPSHFNPKFNSTYIFTRLHLHRSNCWCVEPQRGTVIVQQSQCHPLTFPPAIRKDPRSSNSQRKLHKFFFSPDFSVPWSLLSHWGRHLVKTAIREIRTDRYKFPRTLTSLMCVLNKTGLEFFKLFF